MAKWLRIAAAAVFTTLVLPFLALVLNGVAEGPVVTMLTGWLVTIAKTGWYNYAILAVASLAIGAWLDWTLRKFDRSHDTKVEAISQELLGMRHQLTNILRMYDENIDFDESEMLLAFMEWAAIEISLHKIGIPTPNATWNMDPNNFVSFLGYSKEVLGFIALLEPQLRRGHLKEAKRIGVRVSGAKPPLVALWSKLWRVA